MLSGSGRFSESGNLKRAYEKALSKKREPPDLGDSLFLLQEKIEDDDIHDAGNDRSQYGAETAES